MDINKILNKRAVFDEFCSVNKITVTTDEGEELIEATLDVTCPELPIVIKQGEVCIKINHVDLPQFVMAIATMYNDKYC